MYTILFSIQAQKDKQLLKQAGLETKARVLLRILAENPLQNPPSYEKLKGSLDGYYSRRINRQHRMVYAVFENENTVKIFRMWTRTSNKNPNPIQHIKYKQLISTAKNTLFQVNVEDSLKRSRRLISRIGMR